VILLLLAQLASVSAAADDVVYDDELAPSWYSWSWTGVYDFQAPELVHSGAFAIYASIDPYGALSIHREGGFAYASALRFWIEGDDPPVNLRLESITEGVHAEEIPLSEIATLRSGEWTEITISLDALPPHRWERIDWVESGGAGALIHVDDITLLDLDPSADSFRSAEPVAPDQLMLLGQGDPDAVAVTLDGAPIAISAVSVEGAPTRTYLTLAQPLGAGALVVDTADGAFSRALGAAAASVGGTPTHPISGGIYGVNLPEGYPGDGAMDRYSASTVRWGGNATALYNPVARATNLGADWYFSNEVLQESADDWLVAVEGFGLSSLVTVPSLGWVARDTGSYHYSVERYGEQQAAAPDNPDAGDGVLPDGTLISWNDPEDAAEPWTPADAGAWLAALPDPPDMVAVGNETDIAHLTHRAVHPEPAGYDEQLERFLTYADAAVDALPEALVTGPVSCCWATYWDSALDGDRAAHGDEDFLPWFLDAVADADADAGRRSLDLLDLHYYPEGLIDGSRGGEDDATNAWRLRATRSLWDPDYVDESWIGDSPISSQPDASAVQLIPRMKALIDERYPGTGLALTEWSFGAHDHLSGGLAAADALGIFGREGLDVATLWPAPPLTSPVTSAFQLLRDGEHAFGRWSLPVTTDLDPDLAGVYAASHDDGRIAVLVVNKAPDADLSLSLEGLPSGRLVLRHFGGAADARLIAHPAGRFEGALTAPAYSAVLAVIEPDEADDTDQPWDTAEDTAGPGWRDDAPDSGARCGCVSGVPAPLSAAPRLALPLLALLTALRRRRR